MKREPLHGQFSRDDTGCPRLSKEGTSTAGIAERSLRFGTATHVACRAVPGTLRHSSSSFTETDHARAWSTPASGASRERRSRDRPQGELQRAWLLTRALITLGTTASARFGEIPVGSARSNADRGRKPRAEEDGGLVRVLPVRPFVTAEIGCSGFGLHDVRRSGRVSGRKRFTGRG